ncbi:unnamed protein product [Clavelina lepadiformis]|uniref:HAT C-terminal dimerisation domain-containing protein n=1 Tax=Clavelina lepadiformis TaxID=159417 RepID=A0ABP0G9S7_CLALP
MMVRLHLKSEMISDTTIAVIAPPRNPIPVGDSTTSYVSMMENLFNIGMEVQQSNQEDADDEGADIDTIVTNEVSTYLKDNSNKTDVLEYWSLKKRIPYVVQYLPEIPFAASIICSIRKVLLQRMANCNRPEISTYRKSLRSTKYPTLQQAAS